jgi:phosphatidylglycerophosphate synthase
MSDMPAELKAFPMHELLLVVAFALLVILVCLALVALMFVMAMRIVETTKAGNPFAIENALRLAQIGWLLVAVQAVGFIANMMLSFLPEKLSEHVSIGFDFSPVGVLAVLIIFVLAQIFRHGAEMRAELEGTV